MATIQTIQKKLDEEKTRLQKQLATLSAEDPLSGDMTEAHESGEDATRTAAHDRNIALRREVEMMLADVMDATKRVKEGTYGKCEVCHDAIEPARLALMPTAGLCMRCQQREEKRS
ncbi:MAG: TraR/DksA C4-type zinc finger protein [bacterium]|nr:TraR/DksA C4-type zinc finger protein [bacterium]